MDDLGVYHDKDTVVVLLAVTASGDVHHADPEGGADLGCGDPDGAGSGTHGVQKVVDKTPDLVVDNGDGMAHLL